MKNYFHIPNIFRNLSEDVTNNDNEVQLSLATLVLSILLVFYIILGPLLKKCKIKMIKPSGIIMILGILITLIPKAKNPDSSFYKGFQFNQNLFFTFILPLIIFSSAYNSKIESILKYLRHILLFSISGTIFSFIFITVITFCLNNQKFFTIEIPSKDDGEKIIASLNLNLFEILQFSAAIIASDSVITLSFLMEDNEPKLNAISLGESILNNAISISLFDAVSKLSKDEKHLTFGLPFKILFLGIIIFILSLILGILVGVFHALFLKYLKKFLLNRVQEISTMLLFAFISYTLCNCLNLSPMTALLACGLCMSHYTFYNFNYQTREESSLISVSLSLLAEALIYSSLGMTIIYYTMHLFSIKFIITELILIVVCRIFTIFGQIYILELCGVNPIYFKLKKTHKLILTNTGSIRGIVSYGLSLLIVTPKENHKNLLVGSTIYIVFLTNIICNIISPLFKIKEKKLYNLEYYQRNNADDKSMKYDIFTFIHPNTNTGEAKPPKLKKASTLRFEEKSLIHKFIDYDIKVLMPKIVMNWPEVVEDNNNLSRKIRKHLGDWAEEKEKNLRYKENDTIGINLPGFTVNNSNSDSNKNESDIDENLRIDNIKKIKEKNKEKKIEMKDLI